ncbi:DnaD domain protein [Halonatronum saccharophilum]|uniref:DnaD domain protein n=1 Tax=Halonatronum saccharophilum TaxID=150060 RepID=UPI0004BCC1B2|nr:DnaD domain protein [Halonatronum saccharophilum]
MGDKMSNLLLNEAPLIIQPGLAEKVGINKAIVLQQIHYFLQRSKHIHQGRPWVYNTYKEWQKEHFKFWSTRTVRRIINSLEEDGLLLSANFNKKRYDETKWYTIDYDRLEEKVSEGSDKDQEKEKEKPAGQIDHHPPGQSDQGVVDKLTNTGGQSDQTYTIDYTETTYKDSSSIGEIYEKIFGRTITKHHLEILDTFIDDLGEKVVIFGLEYASSQNAKAMSYVQRVLNDWVKQKVSSVEEAKHQIKQFQKKNRKESRRDGEAPGDNNPNNGEGGQDQSSRLAQKARKLLREGKVSLPEM